MDIERDWKVLSFLYLVETLLQIYITLLTDIKTPTVHSQHCCSFYFIIRSLVIWSLLVAVVTHRPANNSHHYLHSRLKY